MAADGGLLAVLLATCNGERFISQQLRSIADQGWDRIDLYVSDDASSDETHRILGYWQINWEKGRFEVFEGPNAGFSENFRSLLRLPVDADYVAFCDQDDIWDYDKTLAAVNALRASGTTPALYCARTRVVDQHDVFMQLSPLFERAPAFANAVVQNIGGGNTMVMNRAAHQLLREAAWRTPFVAHDWFAYMLITGAGGHVTYSPAPHVHYRQHDSNLIGTNVGFEARLERLRMLWAGRFAAWNEENIASLDACRDLLTPAALKVLDRFRKARSGPLHSRLLNLWRSGAYRQTAWGQLSLYAAGVMGKL